MAVIVTETAAREIRQIIKQQDLDPQQICLRVGVKGGGCSGFSYILDLTESQKDNDEVWQFDYRFNGHAEGASPNGDTGSEKDEAESFSLKVVCDPKSYLYLNETVIDFKDEIMGRGFVFNNPNATSSCGCGSSFSV